jgi:SRSO17 transposase
VAVSLHWGSGEATCPISWRLYLPEEWLEDRRRAREVRLPVAQRYQSKTELALGLIDQAQSWGLPARPLIVDSAFGNRFEFREALRQRQCHYVMAVEPSTLL